MTLNRVFTGFWETKCDIRLEQNESFERKQLRKKPRTDLNDTAYDQLVRNIGVHSELNSKLAGDTLLYNLEK